MPGRLTDRRPSASLVISLLSLFIALGGTAYAATGGTFILGHANSATTASSLTSGVATGNTLGITNTGGKPPLKLTSNPGVAPLAVSNSTKVEKLNADQLDGLDSTSFYLKGGRVVVDGSFPGGGSVSGTNAASNGVSGTSTSGAASGVYGENTSTGYGVAGRASGAGIGVLGDAAGVGSKAAVFNGPVDVNGTMNAGGVDCSGCIGPTDLDRSYIAGRGVVYHQVVSVVPGTTVSLDDFGGVVLKYSCPIEQTSEDGLITFYDTSDNASNIFIDSGTDNPTYVQLPANDYYYAFAAHAGDSRHIQAQGSYGTMIIDAASVHRASDCYVQAVALRLP